MQEVKELRKEVEALKKQVKEIQQILEMAPVINDFDWVEFNERDKQILNQLHVSGKDGATTTFLAQVLGLHHPDKSGRTIIYRRLKRIEKISRFRKGQPIVKPSFKKWYLNFDEYQFTMEK